MKVTTDGCLFGAWVAGKAAASNHKPRKAIDIGAGTGLLSLMLAQKNDLMYISSVEIDKDAAYQAMDNFESSPWRNRLSVIFTNIKTFAPFHKSDLIISNPPFYERELESPDLQKNIAHHSGGLSLDELMGTIALQLEPGGVFYLLLPYKRKDEIEPLIKKHSLHIYEEVLVSQSTKHSPFRIMVKGGNQEEKEIKKSELSICDDNQEYTTAFTEFLKDYYLNL